MKARSKILGIAGAVGFMVGLSSVAGVETGWEPAPRIGAEVEAVWGEWADGEGRVAWRTSSEWRTAGFLVYRIDPETGAETRLGAGAVSAEFQETGAAYRLADPLAAEGGEGVYRLEEVKISGDVFDLGAHAIRFAPPPSAPPQAPARRAAPAAAAKAAGPSPVLKALVKEEGIYGLDLQAIADGMGLALETIQTLAAENGLSVYSEGSPVPTIRDAARGRLLFYGRSTPNPYTREKAYLITVGEGLAMPRRDPGAADDATTVLPATVRLEQDRHLFDSLEGGSEITYYWDYVSSGSATAGSRDFALDLTGCAGDVSLKVVLRGWSSSFWNPDHLAEIRLNGAVVGSVAFDGQEEAAAEATVPFAAVTNGLNTLTVTGVLQPGRSSSCFVVDRIEATFARELTPLPGTAHFGAGGAPAAAAPAYAEPLALVVEDEWNSTWIADETGALPDKAWAAASENEIYAVIEADNVPLLAPEPAAADAWFLAETNRIDYLVVVSRALASAAQELADYRASQGLRVGVAVFEDVCDLMANGLRTPEAIPELLSYAEAYWTEYPWMVVLAGSGHSDYFGALGDEVNHLPPMLVGTAEGLFAADGLLANSGGDELPDVAIGRLPARTPEELTAMIAKIKAYEAEFGAEWQNELVFASDKTDPLTGSFADANSQLSQLADEAHPVAERIDLDATEIAPARASLTNRFSGGAGFIHYTGHGAVNKFSASGLLTAEDVQTMSNARTPVVVALSCLTGRFETSGVDSMGELLMRREQGGAVAVWAPSGLTRLYPSTDLGSDFYRDILQAGSGTIGTSILRARRAAQDDLFTHDTLEIFNLLGDPALRIAGNAGGAPAGANFAQWRWQRFGPAELADPEVGGADARNFSAYALGEGHFLEAELPEFGYPLAPLSPETGGQEVVLRWRQRASRPDVSYHLVVSADLREWREDPPEAQILGAEPDPDGVMETVRARMDFPPSQRVFLGVKAKRR